MTLAGFLGIERLESKIDQVLSKENQIMSAVDDLTRAHAAEKADLATLAGLITQLLTAFASGSFTPAQAQALLAEMNADDSTIKTSITSIQTALGPPPPPGP